jgi:apolipoprotein N-acyltransferase
LIQIADTGGLFSVSLLLLFLGGLCTTAYDYYLNENRRAALMSVSIACIVFAVWYGYGIVKIKNVELQSQNGTVLHVGLIQSNIPDANSLNYFAGSERYNREPVSFDLTRAAKQESAQTQLVIWPESALLSTPNNDEILQKRLSLLARNNKIALIINGTEPNRDSVTFSQKQFYNSSFLISREGAIINKYRKQILFPIGELRLFNRNRFTDAAYSFSPGNESALFDIGEGIKIIPAICYESIIPDHIEVGVRNGGDLIVVQASLRSFGYTPAHKIHRSMTLMLAVIYRLPILYVSNNGLTSVIAPTGKITQELPYLFQKGYVTAAVSIPNTPKKF